MSTSNPKPPSRPRCVPKRARSSEVTAAPGGHREGGGEEFKRWETTPPLPDDCGILVWESSQIEDGIAEKCSTQENTATTEASPFIDDHDKRKFIIPVALKSSLAHSIWFYDQKRSSSNSKREASKEEGVIDHSSCFVQPETTPSKRLTSTIISYVPHVPGGDGRGSKSSNSSSSCFDTRRGCEGGGEVKEDRQLEDIASTPPDIKRYLTRIFKRSQDFSHRSRYLETAINSAHHLHRLPPPPPPSQPSVVATITQQANRSMYKSTRDENQRILQIRKLLPVAATSASAPAEKEDKSELQRKELLSKQLLVMATSRDKKRWGSLKEQKNQILGSTRRRDDSIELWNQSTELAEGGCIWPYMRRTKKGGGGAIAVTGGQFRKFNSEMIFTEANQPELTTNNSHGNTKSRGVFNGSHTPERVDARKGSTAAARDRQSFNLTSDASFFARIFDQITTLDKKSILVQPIPSMQPRHPSSQKQRSSILSQRAMLAAKSSRSNNPLRVGDRKNSLSPSVSSAMMQSIDRVKIAIASHLPTTSRYSKNTFHKRRDTFDHTFIHKRCHSVQS